MKFNLYGRKIEVIRSQGSWRVFYLGPEGKKRLAEDLLIPNHVQEEDLLRYLEDLLHEWASPKKQ